MNKTSSYNYTVKQIIKYMKSDKMNFDFPIQRESGQWSKKQKSLFIHSIIQGYDVPDIYVINEGTDKYEKDCVLDGKQRCTTIYDFFEDKFAMDKDCMPVELYDKEYDVSGLKYSQLPDELKEEFLDYSIRARKMNGFTDREIEEQFYRLNNGSTFTRAQKANVKLGAELSESVSKISKSSFFVEKANFTPTQKKHGEDMSCVLQTMMVIDGFDYKNLSNSEVLRYADMIHRQNEEGKFNFSKIQHLTYLVNRLGVIISDIDTGKKLKRVHIPALISNFNYMESLERNGEITESKYKEFFKYWIEDGIESAEYVDTCGQGSTRRTKVEKRIKVINDELLNFITKC